MASHRSNNMVYYAFFLACFLYDHTFFFRSYYGITLTWLLFVVVVVVGIHESKVIYNNFLKFKHIVSKDMAEGPLDFGGFCPTPLNKGLKGKNVCDHDI